MYISAKRTVTTGFDLLRDWLQSKKRSLCSSHSVKCFLFRKKAFKPIIHKTLYIHTQIQKQKTKQQRIFLLWVIRSISETICQTGTKSRIPYTSHCLCFSLLVCLDAYSTQLHSLAHPPDPTPTPSKKLWKEEWYHPRKKNAGTVSRSCLMWRWGRQKIRCKPFNLVMQRAQSPALDS